MTNNVANSSAGNTEHIAKLVLGECVSGVQSPDFGNLGFIKLGLWQHFAMCTAAFGATFEPHIFNIFVVRTKPDVRGIYAFSVVARMAGEMAFWYRAMNKFIAQAMHQDSLARNLDLAVSVGIKSGFPLPTIVGAALVNLVPKAFLKCFHRCNCTTIYTCTGLHFGVNVPAKKLYDRPLDKLIGADEYWALEAGVMPR